MKKYNTRSKMLKEAFNEDENYYCIVTLDKAWKENAEDDIAIENNLKTYIEQTDEIVVSRIEKIDTLKYKIFGDIRSLAIFVYEFYPEDMEIEDDKIYSVLPIDYYYYEWHYLESQHEDEKTYSFWEALAKRHNVKLLGLTFNTGEHCFLLKGTAPNILSMYHYGDIDWDEIRSSMEPYHSDEYLFIRHENSWNDEYYSICVNDTKIEAENKKPEIAFYNKEFSTMKSAEDFLMKYTRELGDSFNKWKEARKNGDNT